MPITDVPPPRPGAPDDLAGILDIEMLDRDLYRGPLGSDSRNQDWLYGGQVAAQALRAAGLTVADDRFVHSLHGYFLRRGRADRRVILRVWRDRDGRSFSSRRVVALQEGEVIFSMTASFQVDEDSGEYEADGPTDLPDPESLPERFPGWHVDVREITTEQVVDGGRLYSDRMWVRVATPLPDDRLLHACALTYASDLGSGFGQMLIPGLSNGGSSIDHAIWFHRPCRADEWTLLDMWPVMAGGARGMYLGTMRTRDGSLAAMLSQEMLLRQRPSGPTA